MRLGPADHSQTLGAFGNATFPSRGNKLPQYGTACSEKYAAKCCDHVDNAGIPG